MMPRVTSTGQGSPGSSASVACTLTSLSVANIEVRHCHLRRLSRSVARIRIAIIGAGNVGRALGGAWRAAHDVTYGVRSPDDSKYADLGAPAATNASAVAGADVVVLCTPWQGTQQA